MKSKRYQNNTQKSGIRNSYSVIHVNVSVLISCIKNLNNIQNKKQSKQKIHIVKYHKYNLYQSTRYLFLKINNLLISIELV